MEGLSWAGTERKGSDSTGDMWGVGRWVWANVLPGGGGPRKSNCREDGQGKGD